MGILFHLVRASKNSKNEKSNNNIKKKLLRWSQWRAFLML
jgi:hypothetical protein